MGQSTQCLRSIVPLAMFEIILCPQCSRTTWSHTKRFHTHTGHPPRERLSLPPPELPGSSAPLVQHLMVQRPITLFNTGNNTTCSEPLLPVPLLNLIPVPLMRLPQQFRWSNILWYRKAHVLLWYDNEFKENEMLLRYLFYFAIRVMPLSYDAVKRRNIEEEKTIQIIMCHLKSSVISA